MTKARQELNSELIAVTSSDNSDSEDQWLEEFTRRLLAGETPTLTFKPRET